MSTRRLRHAALLAAATLICGAAPALADPAAPASAESPAAPQQSQQPQPEQQPQQPQQKAEPSKAADPAPDLALAVTPLPDKVSLVEGQSFTVSAKITNKGTAEAKGIKGAVESVSGATFEVRAWSDGLNAPLAPNTARDVVLTAKLTKPTADKGELRIVVQGDGDATANDNAQTLTVPIIQPTKTGAVGGVVYTDKDNSATFQDGEGFADVTVTVSGPRVPSREAKTDAKGKFEIAGLPAGWYEVSTPPQLAGGWVVAGKTAVAVDGSDAAKKLELRATRPLTDGLLVSAKFNEGPYKPGDTANLTVSLTNNGPSEAKNLVAICDIDAAVHLAGTEKPANWGELATDGPGVTLKAGEARTLQVKGTVPDAAIEQGVVFVYCELRDKNSSSTAGNPFIFTLAKVPGKNGTGSGTFFHDKNENDELDGEPGVGALPVTLLDPLNGNAIGSATTGADGTFRFADIPAGWYIPVLKGPWKLKKNEFLVVGTGEIGQDQLIPLLRGPLRADLDSGTPPTAPPASNDTADNQSQNRTLASTGANVIGLTIGGVAALLLGVAAVLFTRKRRRG
ncbi:LPXTG cell wall anchor domain-containing protein [Kibdelosporangium phytohabitans]|uniref:Gram-positive cocci surface proteins LPxTG domain-containing protein n=1 Tax=Kibdelosporangium phytohabitans TaxID=860235 RepID=A0A0N9I098_9PSEU|nr:LPXTG cell wall anchor domain-containing protein [Kibdelosporangium phytohabitans]ALG07917.1 hypothetical protein AOZ06_14230 [Kibdelosporangium phytohabitans]MBE1471144.1 LPXTG-motif cell wall-anchored protein [Kibdelosporangium phytohabitans]